MNSETVHPSRLSHGHWNNATQTDEGEGDIAASYSGDTISERESKVRAPFKFSGALWVCISMGPCSRAEAFRLVSRELFEGPTTTYAKKVYPDSGEAARNDPMGFYHGMIVKRGGKEFVLCGTEVAFLPSGESVSATETLPTPEISKQG